MPNQTLQNIHDFFETIRPGQPYTDTVIIQFVNELDGSIWNELYRYKTATDIMRVLNTAAYSLPASVSFNDVVNVFVNGEEIQRIDAGLYQTTGYYRDSAGKLAIYPVPTASDTVAGLHVVYNVPFTKYGDGSIKQVDTITLTGTSGTANVTGAGALTKLATFNGTLTQTATDFVTAHAADYAALGIVVTSSGAGIIFTAGSAGAAFTHPVITNATPDLAGTVVNTTANYIDISMADMVLVPSPYDRMYYEYLIAKMDFLLKDFNSYNNEVDAFSGTWSEYFNFWTAKNPYTKEESGCNLSGQGAQQTLLKKVRT